MKIILTGLGMKSEVKDVPERTSFRFDMVLTQPISVATRSTPERPEIHTKCSFEWNGKYDYTTPNEIAMIYVLTNISKLN